MEKLILGIDDAGKGPLIGPMVLAGVLIKESDQGRLKKLGVKDSKILTPKKRSELFKKITNLVKEYKIIIISPAEIDTHNNLNDLEGEKAAEIINELEPSKAILDCPSPNLKAWKEFIYNKLNNKKIELITAHKSESKFPVVAAASILAKVTRDAEIEKIKKELGVDFGSGYPADEKTTKFLKESSEEHEHIFRKSWSTYKKHKNSKKQAKLDKF